MSALALKTTASEDKNAASQEKLTDTEAETKKLNLKVDSGRKANKRKRDKDQAEQVSGTIASGVFLKALEEAIPKITGCLQSPSTKVNKSIAALENLDPKVLKTTFDAIAKLSTPTGKNKLEALEKLTFAIDAKKNTSLTSLVESLANVELLTNVELLGSKHDSCAAAVHQLTKTLENFQAFAIRLPSRSPWSLSERLSRA